MNIITQIIALFKKEQPVTSPPVEQKVKPRPKWRLEPTHDGRWYVQKWSPSYPHWDYLTQSVAENEEEARQMIANMERPVIPIEDNP